ncbi:MAG: 16S rRNA (uracil(1498)-N(3))-methyltransferase [Cyanobium sp.]
MARELRRLLIPRERLQASAPPAPGGLRVPLNGSEQHYLRRVLRLREGDQVAVVDGAGNLWSAALVASDRLQLVESLEAPRHQQPPPAPILQLALALPRRDVELVWRMATELGIDRLQPLRAERCVAIAEPPLERWRMVVAEACEQCERLWLPAVSGLEEAGSWLAWAGAASADPPLRLLATTRQENLPLLQEWLHAHRPAARELVVAVGPEGGWSPAEEEAALAGHWQPVSLGSTILRSGTAAVAAAALLTAWRAQAEPPAAAQFLR